MAPSKIGVKSTRLIPDGKTSITFNADSKSLEKIKDIAWRKNISNSEVLNAALELYIQDHEKKNGKIKPRPKG